MNLESRWMFACVMGLAMAAGSACGPSSGPGEEPVAPVEEEESETRVRTDVEDDPSLESVTVGCDPRAPDVPCCTTTFSELKLADPYIPWAIRRDGQELELKPMSDVTFAGRFRGTTRLERSEVLDCPTGALAAKLDCSPDRAMVVELEDGSTLELIVPLDVDEMTLTEGDEVELDFAEGLRIWDDARNIVLHLYRPPEEPWTTFERVYGPLRVSLVPRLDDFSTAICIADADADCGGVRIDRLVVEGDDRTTLESGRATMIAGGRTFRVYHLFSAQPLERDGSGCTDLTPPQPSYGIVELR